MPDFNGQPATSSEERLIGSFEIRSDTSTPRPDAKAFLGTVLWEGDKRRVAAAFGRPDVHLSEGGKLLGCDAVVAKAGLAGTGDQKPTGELAKALLAIQQREAIMLRMSHKSGPRP